MFANILFSDSSAYNASEKYYLTKSRAENSQNRGTFVITVFVMKTKKYLLTVILAYPKICLLVKICLLQSSTNHALICILHENFLNGYFTNVRMSHNMTDRCV